MTKIILVDPVHELILHNIEIGTKADVKRFEEYQRQEEKTRGYALDRVILSMHTVRIMEPEDPIPVPVERPRGAMGMQG
jgi:hypothetical protein